MKKSRPCKVWGGWIHFGGAACVCVCVCVCVRDRCEEIEGLGDGGVDEGVMSSELSPRSQIHLKKKYIIKTLRASFASHSTVVQLYLTCLSFCRFIQICYDGLHP